MSCVGFEATITAFERAKTVHALDHVATVIGKRKCIHVFNYTSRREVLCWNEVIYARIFNSSLDGGEFSASRSGRFMGGVRWSSESRHCEEEYKYFPYRESNSRLPGPAGRGLITAGLPTKFSVVKLAT
jgi:hypothetical protein